MFFDALEMRCPRLGGPVHFGYCRQTGKGAKPCFKILDCWWQRFDVAGHLAACLTREEFEALGRHRAPDKITSLIDLIEQAQKNTGRP
jgi:hypothetical protein